MSGLLVHVILFIGCVGLVSYFLAPDTGTITDLVKRMLNLEMNIRKEISDHLKTITELKESNAVLRTTILSYKTAFEQDMREIQRRTQDATDSLQKIRASQRRISNEQFRIKGLTGSVNFQTQQKHKPQIAKAH